MVLSEKFETFHKANPGVYHELVSLARQAKNRGLPKIGMRMLWEMVRWNRMMKMYDPDELDVWKLDDHLAPLYTRLIKENEPDIAHLFETRTRRPGGIESPSAG